MNTHVSHNLNLNQRWRIITHHAQNTFQTLVYVWFWFLTTLLMLRQSFSQYWTKYLSISFVYLQKIYQKTNKYLKSRRKSITVVICDCVKTNIQINKGATNNWLNFTQSCCFDDIDTNAPSSSRDTIYLSLSLWTLTQD